MDNIEDHVMAVYKRIQKQLPDLHYLSFEAATYKHSAETKLQGFIHIGESCESFDSIKELKWHIIDAMEGATRREILSRKFTEIS